MHDSSQVPDPYFTVLYLLAFATDTSPDIKPEAAFCFKACIKPTNGRGFEADLRAMHRMPHVNLLRKCPSRRVNSL